MKRQLHRAWIRVQECLGLIPSRKERMRRFVYYLKELESDNRHALRILEIDPKDPNMWICAYPFLRNANSNLEEALKIAKTLYL